MPRQARKQKIVVSAAITAVFLCAVVFVALFYFGIVHLNNPDPNEYPVYGVDVSGFQGEIDWQTLSRQNIRFAFIKATEGSSFTDRYFAKNWEAAAKTGLRIGAYHFFSFESPGETHAKLFCETVVSVPNMLPPVIDVEYYGKVRTTADIDVTAIKTELRALIGILTEHYGMKPIIYCDGKTYKDIIKTDFADCDLWYRSVYSTAPSEISWTFWQYSNRHVLNGYNGSERYIDMNVFAGNVDEFDLYP